MHVTFFGAICTCSDHNASAAAWSSAAVSIAPLLLAVSTQPSSLPRYPTRAHRPSILVERARLLIALHVFMFSSRNKVGTRASNTTHGVARRRRHRQTETEMRGPARRGGHHKHHHFAPLRHKGGKTSEILDKNIFPTMQEIKSIAHSRAARKRDLARGYLGRTFFYPT